MTPEQIIDAFTTSIILFPEHSQVAKNKAIQDLKQWGREMCHKQKQECLSASDYYENGELCQMNTIDSNDLLDAPYPKELQ